MRADQLPAPPPVWLRVLIGIGAAMLLVLAAVIYAPAIAVGELCRKLRRAA